jgi:hypothetical protein
MQKPKPRNFTTATTVASFLKGMEVTVFYFCMKHLAELAQGKSWTQSDKSPENIKFVSEAIIAFKDRKSPAAKRILGKTRDILFSDESRLLLARNPTMSSYFLTAYASLPAGYRTSAWTKLLKDMTSAFPLPEGDVPRFRMEELIFAKHKLFDESNADFDLREFIFNSAWLSRDQVYCFTHRVFYITDYGAHSYGSEVQYLNQFIEDKCFECYDRKDLDVLLELIICYQAFRNHDPEHLEFFKTLAFRLFKKNAGMLSIFEKNDEENFRKFYHQALLFILMTEEGSTASLSMRNHDFWRVLREMRLRRRFMQQLCKLHVIDTYRSFSNLAGYQHKGYYKHMLDRYAGSLKMAGVLELA